MLEIKKKQKTNTVTEMKNAFDGLVDCIQLRKKSLSLRIFQ